ncbi:MAG: hypothetical protein AB9897_07635 [Anaerolineaceae bacterium]
MLKLINSFLILAFAFSFNLYNHIVLIPVTGTVTTNDPSKTLPLPTVSEFSANITNGNSSQLVGVYVNDLFALPVISQPETNPAFVSLEKEKITQFSMATKYGSIGLVAHNTLAGKHFFDLEAGDSISLIYGDGHQVVYLVNKIYQLKALSPYSPYSKFVDPENPQQVLSVETVFTTFYSVKDRLVFQTCISKDNVDSWGRLFVVADPMIQSVEND